MVICNDIWAYIFGGFTKLIPGYSVFIVLLYYCYIVLGYRVPLKGCRTSSSKSTFPQLFEEKHINEEVIISIIIFHLSKLWKAKFLHCVMLCFWWGFRGNLTLITLGSERAKYNRCDSVGSSGDLSWKTKINNNGNLPCVIGFFFGRTPLIKVRTLHHVWLCRVHILNSVTVVLLQLSPKKDVGRFHWWWSGHCHLWLVRKFTYFSFTLFLVPAMFFQMKNIFKNIILL